MRKKNLLTALSLSAMVMSAVPTTAVQASTDNSTFIDVNGYAPHIAGINITPTTHEIDVRNGATVADLNSELWVDSGKGTFAVYTDNAESTVANPSSVVTSTMVLKVTAEDGITTETYVLNVSGSGTTSSSYNYPVTITDESGNLVTDAVVVTFFDNDLSTASNYNADSNGVYNLTIPSQSTSFKMLAHKIAADGYHIQVSYDWSSLPSQDTKLVGLMLSDVPGSNAGVIEGHIDGVYAAGTILAFTDKANSNAVYTVTTDKNGNYKIALPAGTNYSVTGNDQNGNRIAPITSPISITDGQTVTQNFTIPNGLTPGPSTGSTGSTGSTSALTIKTTASTENGKTVLIGAVSGTDMLNAIQDAQNTAASSDAKKVVLHVDGQGDKVQVQIASDAITGLSSQAPNTVLNVQSSVGSLNIPVAALQQALQQASLQLGGNIQSLQVVVEKVDSATQTMVNNVLQTGGATSVVTPTQFSFEATSTSGTTTEIETSDSYIGHSIDLPSSITDTSNLVGVMVDTTTGRYIPVPTVFSTPNGVTTATLMRKGNSIYTLVSNKKSFADAQSSYAKDAIDTLASKYIISGYEDGTFKPNQHVTRAEFISMLVRALGYTPATSGTTFSDVKVSDWYAGSIGAAVTAHLVNGYADGTFKPNQEISRVEMLQMIYNAMKSSGMFNDKMTLSDIDLVLNQYADHAQVQSWAKEAMAEAIKQGITSGVGNDQLAPSSNADRQQSASFLYRMMQKLGLM